MTHRINQDKADLLRLADFLELKEESIGSGIETLSAGRVREIASTMPDLAPYRLQDLLDAQTPENQHPLMEESLESDEVEFSKGFRDGEGVHHTLTVSIDKSGELLLYKDGNLCELLPTTFPMLSLLPYTKAFMEKVTKVTSSDEYTGLFAFAAAHNVFYKGETFANEYQALAALIKEIES